MRLASSVVLLIGGSILAASSACWWLRQCSCGRVLLSWRHYATEQTNELEVNIIFVVIQKGDNLCSRLGTQHKYSGSRGGSQIHIKVVRVLQSMSNIKLYCACISETALAEVDWYSS